jgi:hypothetical protein
MRILLETKIYRGNENLPGKRKTLTENLPLKLNVASCVAHARQAQIRETYQHARNAIEC